MVNKKIISDVIITKKKKEPVKEIFQPPVETPVIARPLEENYSKKNRGNGLKHRGLAVFFILFILIFLIWRSVNNAKVVVNIVPNSLSVAVDKNIVLAKSGATSGTIPFITGVLENQKSGIYNAEESKVSEKKAEGVVVIYNKSSKDAQILVASTRLESPDGKIFRIPTTIVIPGFTVVNGKTIPGSKEVKVTADKPGTEYNVGLTDFTIPGFKDSPKFKTVYARSKTEIGGGFTGSTKIVTKNASDAASELLIAEVNKNLKNIIAKELLKDQLLLPGSEEFAEVIVETNPKIGEAADKFEIKISGKIRWATVRKKDISAYLLKGEANQSNLGSVETQVTNQDSLAFKLSGYKFDASSFTLNLKGNAKIEAYLDPAIIKNQMVEKHIVSATDVLKLFPGASRAELRFEPVWTGSLPKFLLNPAYRHDHIDIRIQSR